MEPEEIDDILERDIENIKCATNEVANVPKGVRRVCVCTIKGIPDKTCEDELYALFLQLIPGVHISHIKLIHPLHPKKTIRYGDAVEIYCLQAFVKFATDEDCKRSVKFFQPYNERNHGFSIKNKEEISGKLFVHFCYAEPGDTFYIKKMLHVDDLSKIPKQDNKVMIYRVPESTTREELMNFLQKEISAIQTIVDLMFCDHTSKKAIVTMASNEDCDKLVEFFKFYNETSSGLAFTNKAGIQSSLFAYYCYEKHNPASQTRLEGSIVLYNVSVSTTNKDLFNLFDIILECRSNERRVKFCKDNSNKVVTVFATLESNESCDRVVESLKRNGGYEFANMNGDTQFITANYHYMKRKNEVFDIQKVCAKLHQSEISKKKLLNQIRIYNLPLDALAEEIELFLSMKWQDICVSDVELYRDFHQLWQNAVITFDNADDCKKVVDYFAPYVDLHCGYKFETFAGSCSNIILAYAFETNFTQNPYWDSRQRRNTTDSQMDHLDNRVASVCQSSMSPRGIISNVVKEKSSDKQNAEMYGEQLKSLIRLSPKNCPSIIIKNIPLGTEVKEIIEFLNQIENVMLPADCDIFLRAGKVKNQACVNATISIDSCETQVSILNHFHETPQGVAFKNELGQEHSLIVEIVDHSQKMFASIVPNELYLYGVPLETTKEELVKFIKESVSVGEVRVLFLKKLTEISLGVLLIEPCDREKLFNHFKDGCSFQNDNQLCGVLKSNYSFCKVQNQARNILKNRFSVSNIPISTTHMELISYFKQLALKIAFVEASESQDGKTYSAIVTIPVFEDIDRCVAIINKHAVQLVNAVKEVFYLSADYIYDIYDIRVGHMTENYDHCKSFSQIAVHNLPLRTTKEELLMFVSDNVQTISGFNSISVQDAKLQSTAFIKLKWEEAKKFYLFFGKHKRPNGFAFTNKEGISSQVSVVFQEPTDYSEFECRDVHVDADDESHLNKRSNEILFYNLPDSTSKSDVEAFIQISFGFSAHETRIFEPTSCRKTFLNNYPYTWYRYKAFVRFYGETERDIVYEYFKHEPCGVWFANSSGDSSHMKAEYVYENYDKERPHVVMA